MKFLTLLSYPRALNPQIQQLRKVRISAQYSVECSIAVQCNFEGSDYSFWKWFFATLPKACHLEQGLRSGHAGGRFLFFVFQQLRRFVGSYAVFMLFLLPTFWNQSTFNLSGSCVLNWHLPLHKCLLMLHRTLCARLGCGSIVRSSWILNMQQLHSNFAHFQIHDDREAPRSFAILVSERRLWVLQCWTPSNLECFFQSSRNLSVVVFLSDFASDPYFAIFAYISHSALSSPQTFNVKPQNMRLMAVGCWLRSGVPFLGDGLPGVRFTISNLQLHGFLIPSHSLA